MTVLYLIYYVFRFDSYLKKNDYQTWCHLTSTKNLGPGVVNPGRSLRYLYSDSDSENKDLKAYKRKLRFGCGFLLFLTMAMAINGGFLIFGNMVLNFRCIVGVD
jgi:hypothetical protein